MAVQSYKDLLVWQKAMQLVKVTYQMIDKLPNEERFALADQMRRSAVSIPSNIAEGASRNSSKEFIKFLSIANGSKSELMTQFEICKMLGYIENIEEVLVLGDEVGKMLNALIKKLSTSTNH